MDSSDVSVLGVRRGYAAGSVATGAFGTVPGLLLLPYLTERLGVASALAGVVVFAPKAWDVVLNPVAGRMSDRSCGAAGPRRPFLLGGGLTLAAAFMLLFGGPSAPQGLATVWVILLFVVCATAYGFFQVPYVAMPAEITDDYDERTRLMSWRVVVLSLTILASGAGAPAVRTMAGPEHGYRIMGLVVGLVILAGALGAWWGTRNAPLRRMVRSPGSLVGQLAVAARDLSFRSLAVTFVLQALATGLMLADVDYVARVVLHDAQASSLLFVCFVAPAIACATVWLRLGRTWGKRRGYAASSLLLAGGAAGTFLGSRASSPSGVYLAVAVAGIGYAGAQMFPLAMLPDVAARDAARSGVSRAGVFTGVWTAGETLGLALGPGLLGFVLSVSGYAASTNAAGSQPQSAVTAVVLAFSLLPALIVLLSLLALRRYPYR